jgi:oxidase EvaA
MDAKSVISCIPYFRSTAGESGLLELPQAETVTGFGKDLLASAVAFDNAMHSMDTLNRWLIDAKGRYRLDAKSIPLAEVRNWMITEDEIVHETREHFSVIAVSVEAGQREVRRWTQPLLKDASRGLHGFITQKHASILHFLVQAKVEPGNFDVVDLAPTISRSNVDFLRGRTSGIPFLDRLLAAPPEEVRYSVIQSEEGGRFFQMENHNTIIEIDKSDALDLPDHYTWMTLGQLLQFLERGSLSVDARTLLSCLSWI